MTGSLSQPGGGHTQGPASGAGAGGNVGQHSAGGGGVTGADGSGNGGGGGGGGSGGGVINHHQHHQQQQHAQLQAQRKVLRHQQQRSAAAAAATAAVLQHHHHQHQLLQQQQQLPLQPLQPQHHHHHHHHGAFAPHHRSQALQQQQQLLSRTRTPEKHTVHWFRKGLRLHDNPAFVRGVRDSTTFRCVFIIDPWFAGASNTGVNKWRFLLQCLEDLDRSLKRLNSRLFVIRGQPADTLPKLFKKWGTTCLSFEEDPEPFGRVRDQNIQKLCAELGIQVIKCVSHTLFQLENIINRNGGTAPLTYHQFQDVVSALAAPDAAEPPVTAELLTSSHTPTSEDHDDKYGVPTMQELGFDADVLTPPAVWLGGETEALRRLDHHLERKAWVATYGKPKMTPQSLLACQTGLSPYFRFGCLSTRLFYHQLTDLYRRVKLASPPLSLHGQLLWREFFFCSATRNTHFDRMDGNEVCVQIPWHSDPTALAKWSHGQTGFPWIDAIMVQLRTEGWIHHLARHAVACFLTRGDLWISWVEGMKVFEELLLDADWSVNAGMWMWLSGSSFFQQFFHCYCPVKFGRKVDPDGDFIRRYLPVLASMPTEYVHEPWNAPEAVQVGAGCVVGRDYPMPMVNHASVARTNLRRLTQVYMQLENYRAEVGQAIVGGGGEDDKIGGEVEPKPQKQQQQSHAIIVNISSPSPNSVTHNYSDQLLSDGQHGLGASEQNTQTVGSDSDYIMQNVQQQQQQQLDCIFEQSTGDEYPQNYNNEQQQQQSDFVDATANNAVDDLCDTYATVQTGGADGGTGDDDPDTENDIRGQQELNQYLNEEIRHHHHHQTTSATLFDNCMPFMQSNGCGQSKGKGKNG